MKLCENSLKDKVATHGGGEHRAGGAAERVRIRAVA